MTALGFAGGALWALLPGLLRAAQAGQRDDLDPAAQLRRAADRQLLHFRPVAECGKRVLSAIAGLRRRGAAAELWRARASIPACVFGLVCLALYGLVMSRTRWGLEMRAIGGNAEASLRLGIPVPALHDRWPWRSAGGIAGIAGMAEVSAIQGRLVARTVARLRLHGFPRRLARRRQRRRHRGDGLSVRGRQLGRRHPADHAGRPLCGGQSVDGGDPVHRAWPAAAEGRAR